jgi:predicted neuraminidase
MKHQAKFTHKPEQNLQAHAQSQSEQVPREFASSDELLRFDASQMATPPGIAQRLQRSSANIRLGGLRGWWSRLFGRH